MKRRVGEWMTHKVLETNPGAPLFEALEILAEHRVRHVLVRDDGKLVGLLSNRDVVRTTKRDEEGRIDLHNTTVTEVMTPAPLHTILATETLGDAAERMLHHHVNALPVLDGETLTGIITTEDILRAVVSDDRNPRPDC